MTGAAGMLASAARSRYIRRMTPSARPRTMTLALGGLAAGLALLSAVATLGWARHGEQIFVGLLQAGWMTCF